MSADIERFFDTPSRELIKKKLVHFSAAEIEAQRVNIISYMESFTRSFLLWLAEREKSDDDD